MKFQQGVLNLFDQPRWQRTCFSSQNVALGVVLAREAVRLGSWRKEPPCVVETSVLFVSLETRHCCPTSPFLAGRQCPSFPERGPTKALDAASGKATLRSQCCWSLSRIPRGTTGSLSGTAVGTFFGSQAPERLFASSLPVPSRSPLCRPRPQLCTVVCSPAGIRARPSVGTALVAGGSRL